MDLLGTVLAVVAVLALWLTLWLAAGVAPDTPDGRDWTTHPSLRDRPSRLGD